MTALRNSAERIRKPATWALAVACLAAIAASRSAWPLHDATHEAIEEAGALLIGACIVGRLFCTLYIGSRKNALLVRHGPYSVTRNPLYLLSLAGAAGVGLSSGSLALGLVFASGYFLLLDATVRAEERRLLEAFGDEYRAYLREVPRWISAFGRWRDASGLLVDPALVGRRVCESASLLLAIALVETLEQLHEAGVLLAFFSLP